MTTDKEKQTPLPWEAYKTIGAGWEIRHDDPIEDPGPLAKGLTEDDAKLIVKSVTSYDSLRSSVEELLSSGNDVGDMLMVYPQSWTDLNNPENNYEQRTPEMDEHNRKVAVFFEARVKAKHLLAQGGEEK